MNDIITTKKDKNSRLIKLKKVESRNVNEREDKNGEFKTTPFSSQGYVNNRQIESILLKNNNAF